MSQWRAYYSDAHLDYPQYSREQKKILNLADSHALLSGNALSKLVHEESTNNHMLIELPIELDNNNIDKTIGINIAYNTF